MYPLTKYLIGLLLLFTLASCEKDTPKFSPLASLNVANATLSGSNVKLNTNVRDSATLNGYKLFQLNAAKSTGIRLYPTNNPSLSYYDNLHETVNGGIYSIFLTGTATAPEAVFVKDEIPAFSQDSIIRVRVINCSPGSPAFNVSMASASATSIFSNLGYKDLSPFAIVPLKTTIPTGGNVFQIKNTGGTVLASYTLPATGVISIASSRFKSITLVIKGQLGTTTGTNAFGVYAMSNY